MKSSHYFVGLVCVLGVCLKMQGDQPDVLIADFEGPSYADWTVAGDAFGPGPAKGTLPSQMPVNGFLGHGLVNSFHGGDQSTGKLTSPEFTISRKYLSFLIGGGGWEGKTCMNLIVNGKLVRKATGPNTKPGGSEELAPSHWDLGDLAGQQARIETVDDATGGWGHINVDQIVMTDRKPPAMIADAKREITVEKRYLNLPVKNGAPKKRMRVLVDGLAAREFEIELADGTSQTAPVNADWWAFMDLTSFQGKHIVITVDKLREGSLALKAIEQSDEIKGAQNLYHERLRPQFHFTSRRGWNNDPNGLVFYQGEYHMFYQHNPYGWDWGNMHWGHAISRDLVHWRELPIALYPDEHGTMYSGSAVIDWSNTTGFQNGREKPIVCIFTAAGSPFTQGLAYSNDRGRSWTKYQGNPVLAHIAGENRDPKVIWYAPEKKWIMALFLDKETFALFSSPDLKQWQRLSDVPFPGTSECPEFFEIPLDGKRRDTRWVFYGGNGRYLVGTFDGRKFTSESGPHPLNFGNCFYASQTYSDIPPKDGRRILIPWGQMSTPGMPFNQMMGLPVELTLHRDDGQLRLRANPVGELQKLRTKRHSLKSRTLAPGKDPLEGVEGELLEIFADIAVGGSQGIELNLRGVRISYDTLKQEVSCQDKKAPLALQDGRIRLRAFVDRTSVDIFGNDGRLYMPMGVIVPQDNTRLSLLAKGGAARIQSLEVWQLKSAW